VINVNAIATTPRGRFVLTGIAFDAGCTQPAF
jgi:hypothetical protein